MATKPELQPFHFYGSSLCTWKTDADVKVVQRVLEREKEYPYALWFVPLPADAEYAIENYAPVVPGRIYLGTYTKGKRTN